MGFGVWGLGFGVWGLGFGVWGLGFGVWGLGFGVWGLGFGVWGLGFGVWGLGFGVWGLDGTCSWALDAAIRLGPSAELRMVSSIPQTPKSPKAHPVQAELSQLVQFSGERNSDSISRFCRDEKTPKSSNGSF